MRRIGPILIVVLIAVFVASRNPELVDDIKRQVGLEERVEVPAADSAVSGTPGTGPTATPRSVPKSELTVSDLTLIALDLINKDRAAHGVGPVVLGTNQAAQSHADELLKGRYLGHWWLDGRKPYMVYTELGGDTFVSENVARSGYTESEYNDKCTSVGVRCTKVDPVREITVLEHNMVYDDAGSDWGHRDTILDPAHVKVNIGIAYDDYFLAFVEHFEGDAVDVLETPTFVNGDFRLVATIKEPGIEVFDSLPIFWEQVSPESPEAINALTKYCVGGGFSEDCGAPIARIIPPAPPGRYYTNLPANAVIADRWEVSGSRITIEADLGSLTARSGYYTFTLLRDEGTKTSSERLAELSVRVD